MKIGELATSAGVSTQAIRFYERQGLLPQPARLPNGYRSYDHSSAERIAFIQRSQAAGLTLAEVGGVLDIRAEGRAPCAHVADLLSDKLVDIRERIAELTILGSELEALVERSKQLDPADCSSGQICHILQVD
ncbi:MAG: heavy metal-responsive transcriptional regulator [Ilumatobacter sp.]|uniref:heavy metal-responsive transcriptional regulator n=1 Tax=Ilumatobacter sp. TaxID=1967498 RepID=UPI003C73BDAC